MSQVRHAEVGQNNGTAAKVRFESYARIYFERGNGMAVIDTGPGTPRLESYNVIMQGTIKTEHGPDDERPRFWCAMRNCFIKIIGDEAYITTVG